jgi:dolichol-phosphate mannosyltransferase
MQKTISIVIPVYNEEKNIPHIAKAIADVFVTIPYDYEIIFVNDGSRDHSQEVLESLVATDKRISLIELSRNFGKETATSAGIHYAKGDAVMMIDADMQHPPELIPEFIHKWESDVDVVVGIRTKNKREGLIKKVGSYFYYKIMNLISDTPITPRATDFRLIDRKVVEEFKRFTEHDRMTRGIIDWMGFRRSYVHFQANERQFGVASYTNIKLLKLALTSTVSHSLFPLKLAGYLGIITMFLSGILGVVIFVQRYIFDDMLGWNISGTGQLAVLIVFFIGIILACLGLVALYIGSIRNEVSGRPLYVVREIKGRKNGILTN